MLSIIMTLQKFGYFGAINLAFKTIVKGMNLTLRHIRQARSRRKPMGIEAANYFEQQTGMVTIQYPSEQIPVPDVGRYRLYMETPDCIVCDQCARICPVDCIKIEKIKATDVIGTTSDGSKVRFWLPTFDIDLAKCCFCGLCTVVCPTECLTMTPVYDYATDKRQDLVFHFGNLTPSQAAEKQAELEAFEAAKKAAKAAANS